MAHWYSEEMRLFHTVEKMSTYNVYHWYYTGAAQGWTPKDLKWGYVGISPYEVIQERYRIERKECELGLRPRKRKVIEMLDKFLPENKVKLRIIGVNLSRKEALKIESALRPEGHTCWSDGRIWNEVAGG